LLNIGFNVVLSLISSPLLGYISGLSVKKAWTGAAHAFSSSNFKGLIEYIGWQVVFRPVPPRIQR